MDNVRISIKDFYAAYPAYFAEDDYKALDKIDAPNTLFRCNEK